MNFCRERRSLTAQRVLRMRKSVELHRHKQQAMKQMCQTSNLGVLTATSYRKEIGKLNLELHTVVCDIRCVMKEIRLVCNAEVDDDQDTDSASQASHSEEIHSQDPLPTYGNSSAGGLLSAVQEGPQPDGTVKDFESKACSSSDEDDTSKADAEAELIAKYSGLADGDSGKMVPASDLLAMMQVVNRNSDRLAVSAVSNGNRQI